MNLDLKEIQIIWNKRYPKLMISLFSLTNVFYQFLKFSPNSCHLILLFKQLKLMYYQINLLKLFMNSLQPQLYKTSSDNNFYK